jgi:hypothetical protein
VLEGKLVSRALLATQASLCLSMLPDLFVSTTHGALKEKDGKMRIRKPQKINSPHKVSVGSSKKSALRSTSFNSLVRIHKAKIRSDNSFKLKTNSRAICKYVLMFLETSSIHGLNHLISKKRAISER